MTEQWPSPDPVHTGLVVLTTELSLVIAGVGLSLSLARQGGMIARVATRRDGTIEFPHVFRAKSEAIKQNSSETNEGDEQIRRRCVDSRERHRSVASFLIRDSYRHWWSLVMGWMMGGVALWMMWLYGWCGSMDGVDDMMKQ